jgi:1,4-alpha-glucan branching enzyme
MLSGLTAGDYTIEIYFKATSSDGNHFSNNGGANYKATFTVKNVTITPAFPTRSEQVTITLNATGTALETATTIYFHSGVATDVPDSYQFSKSIGNWGTDDGIGEMTQTGNPNVWTITLPSIDTYYSLNTNDDAFALNFLFRNEDGTAKEDNNGANYHLEINPENYFLITNPTYNPFLVETNKPFNITGEANTSANWTLKELDEFGAVINANLNSATTQNYTFSYSISDIDITHFYQLSVDFGTETKTKTFEVQAYGVVQSTIKPVGAQKGINYDFPNTNEVTFVLHTPTTTTYNYFDSNNCSSTSTGTTASKNIVHLIGDFNNWEASSAYQLNKDGDYWWITLDTSTLLPVQDEYVFQYLIDGEIRIGDPYAEKISDSEDIHIATSVYPNLIAYPTGKTTGRASVLELNKTEYVWKSQSFSRTIPRNELNIYELHFRDFTAEGTYKAATAKLDYIKELGINCIHVMPVSEFEGNNSWGYNPNYYFAADKAYGTANDLKEFIDEAHLRGIAVVNDLVLNHAFYSNPNAMLYWNKTLNRPANNNPWFNPEHKGIYDTAGHWGADWNHASEHTQEMVDEILDYWISEFKFDGFRFDFTKGFTQADQDSGDPWASSYDVCRVEILKRMVDKMWLNHPNTYAIFEHLANDAEDTVLADYGILLWSGAGPQESWAEMAMGTNIKSFSSSLYTTRGFTYANYMSYMESHDEERIGYKVINWGVNNDATTKYLANRLKLPAAFNMFLPGPRMVWQFGELGYDISIDQNGRTGDKPSAWELGYDTDADRQQIYNLYSHIFKFRNNFDLYTNFDKGNIDSTTDWVRRMSLTDNTPNSSGNPTQVIIVGNFEAANNNNATPSYSYTGDWFKYNGDPAVDGTKFTVTTTNEIYLLFKHDPVYILSNADIIDPQITTSTTAIDALNACSYTISGTNHDFTEETWVANTAPAAQKASDNGTINELYYSKVNGLNTTGKPTSLDGITLNIGENIIEWTVTDTFGNTNTCEQIINVSSTAILPTATLQEITPIAEGTATTVFIDTPNAGYTYNWYLSETDTNPVSGTDFTTESLTESTDYWVEAIETATSCSSGKIKFTVPVSSTLSTDDYDYLNKIISYPNPTQGTINIIIPNLVHEVPIIITNIQGQIICQKSYLARNGEIQIDISKNPTGIYIIKLLFEKPKVLKIIKY